MRRRGWAAALRCCAIASGAVLLFATGERGDARSAEIPVELELVLAVDASSSVSGWEFDHQMRGLAEAFRIVDVMAVVGGLAPNGMAVALGEWSSPGQQVVAVDWSVVSDAESAAPAPSPSLPPTIRTTPTPCA